jgi:hypothetical protein
MIERVAPGLVGISTGGRRAERIPLLNDPVFREFFAELQCRGKGGPGGAQAGPPPLQPSVSGVIVDSVQGILWTNHHAIDGAARLVVVLNDRRELDATAHRSLEHRPPTPYRDQHRAATALWRTSGTSIRLDLGESPGALSCAAPSGSTPGTHLRPPIHGSRNRIEWLPFCEGGHDAFADPSLDGRRLTFVRGKGPAERVYVADLGGGSAWLLTPPPGSVPGWSPHGARSAFSGSRLVIGGMFTIAADGREKRR